MPDAPQPHPPVIVIAWRKLDRGRQPWTQWEVEYSDGTKRIVMAQPSIGDQMP